MTTSQETLSPAAETNGQLWGGRARVWADIQEPISLPCMSRRSNAQAWEQDALP